MAKAIINAKVIWVHFKLSHLIWLHLPNLIPGPSPKEKGVAKIKKKISAKNRTQFEQQVEMHPVIFIIAQ
jgi:hypothetical protein